MIENGIDITPRLKFPKISYSPRYKTLNPFRIKIKQAANWSKTLVRTINLKMSSNNPDKNTINDVKRINL